MALKKKVTSSLTIIIASLSNGQNSGTYHTFMVAVHLGVMCSPFADPAKLDSFDNQTTHLTSAIIHLTEKVMKVNKPLV